MHFELFSDYAYGALGVATFTLELGEQFYEDCDLFEETILPTNLKALIYATKLAKKPFSLIQGPDITDLNITVDNGVMTLLTKIRPIRLLYQDNIQRNVYVMLIQFIDGVLV